MLVENPAKIVNCHERLLNDKSNVLLEETKFLIDVLMALVQPVYSYNYSVLMTTKSDPKIRNDSLVAVYCYVVLLSLIEDPIYMYYSDYIELKIKA